MALNFPSNPVLGQEYTEGAKSWTFDGVAWKVTGVGVLGFPVDGGGVDPVEILQEVDTRIATHNQATPVHDSATSGRDFVALFQNGLI